MRCTFALPLLAAAVLLLAGCAEKRKAPSADFSRLSVYELEGKAVSVDSVYMRYPYRIRVEGDVAVVFDLHAADRCCHAFTYPEFGYLASFGRVGEGPEEILSGSDVRFLGPNRVGILDSNGRKIAVYGGIGRGMTPVLERMVRMEETVLLPLDFVPLSGGGFLMPDYSGKSRFCIVDSCGRLCERRAEIPVADKELLAASAPAVAQAWRSFLSLTPDGEQLVAATQLGDALDCYALPAMDGEQTHCIGPDGEPAFSVSAEGYGIPEGCMGYWDVQVTDSRIYALYDGTRFDDLMKQNPSEAQQGARRLRVFTLSGEPECSYEFDRPLAGFFVDEARGLIWAADVNAGTPLFAFVWKR